MDRLAIITLTRTPELFDQLADLLDGELPPRTLPIVVNNASSPDIAATALQHRWACIDAGRNLSFSEGNNLAAEVAVQQGCTHLLLVNDDLIPDAGFVGKMWSARTDAGVVGATFVHDDGTVNHAGALIYPHCGTDHMGRNDPLELWERDEVVPVVAVTFACAMVPVSVWQQLKGLDTRYLWGWEDTDFCLRVIESGGTNYMNRGAVAVHNECGTRPRGSVGDFANRDLFVQTWQEKLPDMLRAYFKREPQAEGVKP